MPITKGELDTYFNVNYYKLCKDVNRLIYLRNSDITSGDVVVSECYLTCSGKLQDFNDLNHLEGYIINYINNHTRWYNSAIRKFNDKLDRFNSLDDESYILNTLDNEDDIDMNKVYESLIERYRYVLGHWRRRIFDYWLMEVNTHASFQAKFPGFTRSYITQLLKEQKEIEREWKEFVKFEIGYEDYEE